METAEMQSSEAINEIAAALAKAQGKITNAVKDADNTFFKKVDGTFSKYATLASALHACRVPLSENGIAVLQFPSTDAAGSVSVSTMLSHSSGQWFRCTLSVRPAKPDAQSIGSVISYLRRYGLCAMVGVAPDDDDDDDGNAGTGMTLTGKTPPRPTRQDKPAPQPPEPPKPSNPFDVPVPINADGTASDWTQWCKYLLPERLEACKTEDEARQVLETVNPQIQTLATAMPKWYTRLQEVIKAKMSRWSPEMTKEKAMLAFSQATDHHVLSELMRSLNDDIAADPEVFDAYEAAREALTAIAP